MPPDGLLLGFLLDFLLGFLLGSCETSARLPATVPARLLLVFMQFLGTKRVPTFQGAHKAEIQLQRTAPPAAAAD